MNALPDDVARESVLLVLRKSLGSTGICRFFALPEAERRLRYLGPGEVMMDAGIDDLLAGSPCVP